jgi:hypothetical protein
VVTRGASAGGGNLTLDFLYLSDGWRRNSSENRVNNINILEVYHEIRLNLNIGSTFHRTRVVIDGSGNGAIVDYLIRP